jgi:hypothetical protein
MTERGEKAVKAPQPSDHMGDFGILQQPRTLLQDPPLRDPYICCPCNAIRGRRSWTKVVWKAG